MNQEKLRQVILDIETTGMNQQGCVYLNHKVIEIGIIELVNRKYTGKYLHYYLNPGRTVDPEAYKIHGISDSFLLPKPTFRDVCANVINFINNSEIIVHNAAFDISFLDYELSFVDSLNKNISHLSIITDTLVIARQLFPGKKNSLDALCRRYKIFNVNRKFHSALLDAKILMKIYLYLTSRQNEIEFQVHESVLNIKTINKKNINTNTSLKITYASQSECTKHSEYMQRIQKK
ncbi:DNA polymerase III subunit epsilon [Buchnera aphidicola]|uniref:DNA polymerase III subunit epsilon n=1 Tax=Buchnera aphidicola TaxID=9 RepID=UPI00094C6C52|nr:DNA polymerase III subunit epsilon [Buchnera aphidicola]